MIITFPFFSRYFVTETPPWTSQGVVCFVLEISCDPLREGTIAELREKVNKKSL
jgi:hypothetical protein